MPRHQTIFLLLLTTLPLRAADLNSLPPLHQSNCLQCHGDKKQKVGINFAPLNDHLSILRNRKLWRKALQQVQSGEMPPEESKQQPTDAERQQLVQWLKAATEIDPADSANIDPGPPVIRRLNLREYNRTIRDLTTLDFNAGDVGITEESAVGGFDNLAAAMDIAPALMEKYFIAADKISTRIFAANDPNLASYTQDANNKNRSLAAYKTLIIAKPAADLPAPAAAEKVLRSFLRRAYRRPPTDTEITRFNKLFESLTAKGESYDGALRFCFKAILVSPNFLLRAERDRTDLPANQAYRITDHELATRLAYFLWAAPPDESLLTLADQGKLSDPDILQAQVKRLLLDYKSKTLTEAFAQQFLQLKKLSNARPSTEFFPAFNNDLKRAMQLEIEVFVDKLREEDKSLLDLLDADYTYANEALAKHYNIPNITGQQMRRVDLKPEYHRGGLLGMAGFHAFTSHTSRTSPTLRGKYVLDVLLGTPPAPPPANVSQLKEEKDKKDPKTFREQLNQHAADATCAGCHKKMDPLGFALENYDAIGTWREPAPSHPIDNFGQLPTGEKMHGVNDLKKIIQARKSQFIQNVAEQMLIYALGRELDYYDELPIQQITTNLAKENFTFSSLIIQIAKSYPFQNRKGIPSQP